MNVYFVCLIVPDSINATSESNYCIVALTYMQQIIYFISKPIFCKPRSSVKRLMLLEQRHFIMMCCRFCMLLYSLNIGMNQMQFRQYMLPLNTKYLYFVLILNAQINVHNSKEKMKQSDCFCSQTTVYYYTSWRITANQYFFSDLQHEK